MQRASRDHTEEFYEVTDAEPDLSSLQAEPRAWDTVCKIPTEARYSAGVR